MATINEYFEQAQLSQAAYALTLEKGMYRDAYPEYVTKGVSRKESKADLSSFNG